MKERQLDSNGLQVSTIGYGCMGLEGTYGPATDRREAISIGVTHFDAAKVDGPFTNGKVRVMNKKEIV